MNGPTDWRRWHDDYDDPDSSLSRRLRVVQTRIRGWLATSAGTGLHVLSMCAGQGRDILPVAAEARSRRLRLTLVESDVSNAQQARESAQRLGVDVEVRCADAGVSRTYVGVPRADLLLACGIFGNIADADVLRTVDALPQLCNRAATVIWTRSRRAPDFTGGIRARLARAGFAERGFDAPDDALFSVGTCQLMARTEPLVDDRTWFTFRN